MIKCYTKNKSVFTNNCNTNLVLRILEWLAYFSIQIIPTFHYHSLSCKNVKKKKRHRKGNLCTVGNSLYFKKNPYNIKFKLGSLSQLLIFNIYILLKENWLTVFQVHNKVIQLYNTYISFLTLLSIFSYYIDNGSLCYTVN